MTDAGHHVPPQRTLFEVRDLRNARAEQIMSTRVFSIDGGASVAEAIRKMRAEHVSCLITERRGPQDAWGIITRADIILKVIGPGRDPETTPVHEIVTKPLLTVSPGLALKYCLGLMQMGGVRRVAVFDGHEMKGLITHADILAAIKV